METFSHMPNLAIIEAPSIKPKVKIERVTKYRLLNKTREESQVIIHCLYKGSIWFDRIRIWQTTFLYAKDSSHRSKLVHVDKITLYPEWMPVEVGEEKHFTLIFTGLPKHCKVFDLIERIPEPGGFEVRNIPRNVSDIYQVEIK